MMRDDCKIQGSKGEAIRGMIVPPAPVLYLCALLMFCSTSYALDLPVAVAGIQGRYASVSTIKGSFRQTYRAPGIRQEQSGEFWLKKPALMRWEYRMPDEQLFVVDGKYSYLYVPRDRQVTIQPLSAADLHNTPLELLLGSGDIDREYTASWENQIKPRAEGTVLVRLTPRKQQPDYLFLVLEIDGKTFDLRGITMREHSGGTSEFFFSNVITNVKVENKHFEFKTPKGVEEIRFNKDQ